MIGPARSVSSLTPKILSDRCKAESKDEDVLKPNVIGVWNWGEGGKEIFWEFGRKAGAAAVRIKWIRIGF